MRWSIGKLRSDGNRRERHRLVNEKQCFEALHDLARRRRDMSVGPAPAPNRGRECAVFRQKPCATTARGDARNLKQS
jgi:hypothetical protein